jgi:hypothetical protein
MGIQRPAGAAERSGRAGLGEAGPSPWRLRFRLVRTRHVRFIIPRGIKSASRRLAEAAHDNRLLPSGELDQTRLAVLADALEEASCTDAQLLRHLRSEGPHYRGCFVVDAILGRS